MKKYYLIIAFVSLCVLTFAQDTTSVNVNYVAGSSLIDFFKLNYMAFGLLFLAILEYLIGKYQKVKENSTIELLFRILKSTALCSE